MSLHKPSPEPEEKYLFTEANSFNYAALDSKTRIIVQQCASEIKERLEDAVQAIWEIGQKLVDVRNCLNYGQFNSWLKIEFQWSRSTAYNYINVCFWDICTLYFRYILGYFYRFFLNIQHF